MRTLLLPLLFLAACAAPNQHRHHSFDDANAWAQSFEDPSRDEWQKPAEVIAALNLPKSARIADIGSATGYFSTRLAKAVPEGKVYGLDVESSMVEYLDARAEKEGIGNLTAQLAAFDDPKIPEPVDLIIVVDTYHHLDARKVYFAKLAEKLKPDGRIVIIDFKRESKMGPPADMKVGPEAVRAELEAAGYKLATSHDFLPEQFFLVFRR
ncbi:MAG: class I SAM-dependent methyltransferase [Archangium sp.]